MGGVYVTHVADVDKGHWHVVTLVLSFNAPNDTISSLNDRNTQAGLILSHQIPTVSHYYASHTEAEGSF